MDDNLLVFTYVYLTLILFHFSLLKIAVEDIILSNFFLAELCWVTLWYKQNVCIHLTYLCWNPYPGAMVVGGGTFSRCLGHAGIVQSHYERD